MSKRGGRHCMRLYPVITEQVIPMSQPSSVRGCIWIGHFVSLLLWVVLRRFRNPSLTPEFVGCGRTGPEEAENRNANTGPAG